MKNIIPCSPRTSLRLRGGSPDKDGTGPVTARFFLCPAAPYISVIGTIYVIKVPRRLFLNNWIKRDTDYGFRRP